MLLLKVEAWLKFFFFLNSQTWNEAVDGVWDPCVYVLVPVWVDVLLGVLLTEERFSVFMKLGKCSQADNNVKSQKLLLRCLVVQLGDMSETVFVDIINYHEKSQISICFWFKCCKVRIVGWVWAWCLCWNCSAQHCYEIVVYYILCRDFNLNYDYGF